MAEKKEPRPSDVFRIKVIKGHQAKTEAHRDTWDEAVRAYRSQFYRQGGIKDDADDLLVVENNWLFGFTETLVANICPSNPQVTITHRRPELKNAAEYRQALVNDFFIRDKLYQKLWKGSGRAVIYPRVFFKVAWSKRKERPVLRVLTPEYVFFDDTAEEWEDCRYLVEVVPMTRAEFEQRTKNKKGYRSDAAESASYGAYPGWLKTEGPSKTEHEIAAENFEWIIVYEFYDFVEKKLFHYLADDPDPLFEGDLPYFYLENNFYMLSYNDNLQDMGGVSDAQLVLPTIRALNEMTTLQLWHNQASIPKVIVNEALCEDPDAFWSALQNVTGPGDGIGVRFRNNASINQVMGNTPVPSLPINWESSKADLREVVEFILGIASYQRGGLGQSDVATELALSDTAIRTRNARRQKAIYGVLEWLAEAVIALYMQYLPEDTEIPLRLGIDDDVALVGREGLGMRPRLRQGEQLKQPDPFGYDYTARPYNAQEQNSIAQLKMLTNYAQLLFQDPNVDKRKLIERLLELIHMEGVLTDPEEMQAAMAPAGIPMEGGQEVPPGVTPDMAGPLQGGQVNVGSGAQAVEAGLEGGPQPGGGASQE